MDLTARVKEVLEQTHLMNLGTMDEAGVWVSSVIFVFDDTLTLYWMSDPAARHSKAIEREPQVAGTITASTKSKEPNLGIQFEGTATRIEGPRHDLAIKHRVKRGHPTPSVDDDVLDGDSWYQLVPSRIRLIDEANFGFDTQDVPR